MLKPSSWFAILSLPNFLWSPVLVEELCVCVAVSRTCLFSPDLSVSTLLGVVEALICSSLCSWLCFPWACTLVSPGLFTMSLSRFSCSCWSSMWIFRIDSWPANALPWTRAPSDGNGENPMPRKEIYNVVRWSYH